MMVVMRLMMVVVMLVMMVLMMILMMVVVMVVVMVVMLIPDGASHCFQLQISCCRTQDRSIEGLPFYYHNYFCLLFPLPFWFILEINDGFTDLSYFFGHHVHLERVKLDSSLKKDWVQMWENLGSPFKRKIFLMEEITVRWLKIWPVLTKSSQPFPL